MPQLAAAVRRWRKVVGAIPGPMEAWLAHRSLATLQLRVDRQCANALALAEALGGRARGDRAALSRACRPTPRTRSPRGRCGASAAWSRSCCPTAAHAERFLDALRLVDDATSFGGVRSTAERRGRWGGDAVPEGFIRFSVGRRGRRRIWWRMCCGRWTRPHGADRGRPAEPHSDESRGARAASGAGGVRRRTPRHAAGLRTTGGPSLPPHGSDRPRFHARRTARTRLVDSASVSNHSSDSDLSTYL